VVVGAGSGIGRASALALASFGAQVHCADIDGESAADTVGDIVGQGGEASASVTDVTDARSVESLIGSLPVPDVVLITPAINLRRAMFDLTDSNLQDILDVNLVAPFRLLRDFARGMASRGAGSLIVISSIRAFVVEPGQSAYAASKAAVLLMVRTLAGEIGPAGVRVNAIAPGVVETPLTATIRADEGWRDAYAAKTALRRWAHVDELVGAVVYLASDASSYVTGSCLVVDGGWTAIDGRFDPPL